MPINFYIQLIHDSFNRKIDNVYGADPSGIFRNAKFNEDSRTVSKLTTWEMLYQRELELLATQPPSNGFQQMILWTKQGKVWQFPIDNEQGTLSPITSYTIHPTKTIAR